MRINSASKLFRILFGLINSCKGFLDRETGGAPMCVKFLKSIFVRDTTQDSSQFQEKRPPERTIVLIAGFLRSNSCSFDPIRVRLEAVPRVGFRTGTLRRPVYERKA